MIAHRCSQRLDPGQITARLGQVIPVAEAAFVALSRSKQYELMDAGQLAYVKIGRAGCLPMAVFLTLIDANRVED